jgi:pimeloyl-ACP methyl ester carboxylesterase
MSGIAVIREGDGPEVLLVHGGASPPTTWAGLEGLRARWTLAFAYRRGYSPSPPAPEGKQDWEVDAEGVGALLDGRPQRSAASAAGSRQPIGSASSTMIPSGPRT